MRLLKLLCVGALLCSSFSPTIAYMDDNVGFVNTEEAAAPQTDEIEQTVESSPEAVVEEEVPAAAEAEAPPEETAVVEETPTAEAESIEVPPLPIPDKTPDASGILEDIASGPASRIFLDDNLRSLKRQHAGLTYIEGVLRHTFMNFPRMYLDINVGATATQSVSFPTWSVYNAGWDSWVGRISGNAWGGHAWYTHIYYGDHPSYRSTWELWGLTAQTTGHAGSTEAGGIEVSHSLTRSGHTMTFTVNLRRTRPWDPNRPDEWSNITADRIVLDSTVVSYDSRYPHSPPMRVNHVDEFAAPEMYLGWIPITNRYVEPVVTAVPSQNNFIPLGNAIHEGNTTNSEQINYRGLIDHIVVNGQVRRDFEVSRTSNNLDTLWVGTRNLSLQVHFDFAGARRTAVVEVPVNVGWQTGSTIILGLGEGEGPMPGFTAAGMTLLDVQQGLRVRHTFGQGSNQIDMHLNRNFTGRTYYDFRGVVVNGERNLNNVDAQPWSLNWSAQGQQMRSENVPRAQTFTTNHQNLLFAVYHAEGKIWLTEYGQPLPNFTAGAPRWEFFRREGAQFIPLQVHRLPEQTTVHEVPFGITREELNRNVANYIDLGNNNRVRAVEFVAFPNTSASGRQEGVIRVAEELSPGNEVTYDYTISFNVAASLEVNAVNIPVLLGTTTDEVEARDLSPYLEVKLNGRVLSPNEYEVSFVSTTLNTLTVGIPQHRPTIRISYAGGGVDPVELVLPINVEWGDSIVFGGAEPLTERTVAAFTLHHGTNPRIVTAYGNGNDINPINMNFAGQPYYRFNWFDLANVSELVLTDNSGDQHIEVRGDTSKQAVMTWRSQNVNYGDVVRTWVADASRNVLWENNRFVNRGGEVYYEITTSGYRPLNINRIVTTEQIVDLNTSQSELDSRLLEFIDVSNFENIEPVNFVRYPDTSRLGQTEGIIRVAETLASGERVMYDYTVIFNVEDLVVTAVPSQNNFIPLGSGINAGSTTNTDQINYRDLIDHITVNGTELRNFAVSPGPEDLDTSWAGTRDLQLVVSFVHAGALQTALVEIPVEVGWQTGNTIVFGSDQEGRSAAAMNLMRNQNGGVRLTHTAGLGNDNLALHPGFSGKTYFDFREVDVNGSRNLNDIDAIPWDTIWNADGDVLKQTGVGNVMRMTDGSNQVFAVYHAEGKIWLSEEGQMPNYSESSAPRWEFFRRVINQFVPLQVHRLPEQTTVHEVPFGMTREELNQNVTNYIDRGNNNRVRAIEFVEFPDTSASGRQEGVIRVAEELPLGNEVTYDYTISFNVAASLEVNAVNIPVVLGTTIGEVEARDLSPYLEVKLNGQVLSPNEYEVSFVSTTLNTLTVGLPQHRPTIRISYAGGGVDPVELVLPINVEWGDSIVFGGAEPLTQRTVAAFTLHHGTNPRISPAYGNGHDTNPVNMNFAGLPYYRFNWFDLANVSELVLTDNSGNQHIEVRGDTSKQAVMTWRSQNVNYGDVVRTWVADASRNVLWENNRFVNHGGEVYYEITPSGYRPLNINRVVTTEQEIDLNTSQSELDSRLLEFIDVSSFEHVEVFNFVSYPDTSRSGQTEGIIRVAETLASGERVMYDYTVVFNVADSKTMIDVSLPKEIVFGSTDLYEGEVVSPVYNIENKGTGELRVNVQAVDVTNNDNQLALLSSSEEAPTGTSNAVRLVMNTEARSVDLHGNTSNQILADLSPNQSAQFTIGGNYFGEYGEAIRLGLDIHYRFEMIP